MREALAEFLALPIGIMVGFLVLASVDPQHNPVLSVAIAPLFVVIALFLPLVLQHSAIDQMQPAVIHSGHPQSSAERVSVNSLCSSTRDGSLGGEAE